MREGSYMDSKSDAINKKKVRKNMEHVRLINWGW